MRDISSSSGRQIQVTSSAVRWWACRLGIYGALLTAVLSPILSMISFGDTDKWWGFCLLSVAMFAMSVNNGEQAIMQGKSQFSRLAKSAMWGAVSGTAFSLPLYYFMGTRSIVPSIIIFSLATMTASCIYSDTKRTKNPPHLNRDIGKKFLKLGFFLTIPAIASTAASYIFISYLNSSYSESVTGIFQSGYTLVIRYTGIVFTALSMEFFPRISKTATRKAFTSTLVSHEILLILYVLTPLLVVFVALDRVAILILYTEDFLEALPFVTIGCLAMIFRGVSYCMAYVMIARGEGRTYLVMELISATVGLTLNILLFRCLSFTGLGISYVLWYGIYTVMAWIVFSRYGMTLHRKAKMAVVFSVLTVATAIALKAMGWWIPILVLIPSGLLAWQGYKKVRS